MYVLDPNGTGILFFEFFRILEQLKRKNKDEKLELFWMFENVRNMDNITKDTISK